MSDCSKESRNLISKWQQSILNKLDIDLVKNRYKKHGVKSFVIKPFSLVDEKWDYKEIDQSLKNKIVQQSENAKTLTNSIVDLFEEKLRFVLKNGQYYFLQTKKIKIIVFLYVIYIMKLTMKIFI